MAGIVVGIAEEDIAEEGIAGQVAVEQGIVVADIVVVGIVEDIGGFGVGYRVGAR